jgi:hypothetical protein
MQGFGYSKVLRLKNRFLVQHRKPEKEIGGYLGKLDGKKLAAHCS